MPFEDESGGRVMRDERGNAVWGWVKSAGRIAIDSTSRLLRKLEAPELTVEDTSTKQLRILPDGEPSGGDPYNQPIKHHRPNR